MNPTQRQPSVSLTVCFIGDDPDLKKELHNILTDKGELQHFGLSKYLTMQSFDGDWMQSIEAAVSKCQAVVIQWPKPFPAWMFIACVRIRNSNPHAGMLAFCESSEQFEEAALCELRCTCRVEELRDRIHVLARYYNQSVNDPVQISHDGFRMTLGPLVLDKQRRTVEVHGNEVHLTDYGYRAVEYMLGRFGQVISRDEFLSMAFNTPYQTTSNTVDNLIFRIRHAFRTQVNIALIGTQRGHGYFIHEPRLHSRTDPGKTSRRPDRGPHKALNVHVESRQTR